MNKKSIIIIGVELLVLICLYIFINSEYIKIIPQCWIHKNTGLLCPSCGGTRCVIYMLKGNFIKAFFSHMIYFILFAYLFIVNLIYLINLNKQKKVATWIYPKAWYAILFTVILLIYTIFRNIL